MHMKAITSGVALAAMMAITPAATAQSSYWSYDGQTNYSSYASCEEARSTTTMRGAAIGGLLGAGAGAMAGGDDTRNAIVGAMIGAAAGGIVGNRQVQCAEYQYPTQNTSYSTHSNTRYVTNSQPYYGQQQSNGYYEQRQYNQGYQTYPARQYTTQRSYSTYNGGSTYNNGYQSGGSYNRGYSSQPTYNYGNNGYQTHRGYQQPTYNNGHHNGRYNGNGYQTVSRHAQPTYSYSQPAAERWSYDGQTMFRSYGECNEARRSRTLAGGGIGALAGAGLGAMAGGDDTRNAAVGAVIGGAIGAYTGQRSIQCTQY